MTAHPRRMPKSLSATALSLYERCPRQFALRYLTDAPQQQLPTPNLLLGNAVHGALADYVRLSGSERTVSNIERLLRLHWSMGPREQVFIHEEEEIAWGQRALALVASFAQATPSTLMPFAVEEWVRAQLPNGRRVCGRIDRADRTAEGLILIDYKTGRRPDDFDASRELAARLYALSAFRTFRINIAAVRFDWLTDGQSDRWCCERDDLAEIEDELSELTEQLVSDRSMTPRPGGHCVRCPYRDFCPAGRGPLGSHQQELAALPF